MKPWVPEQGGSKDKAERGMVGDKRTNEELKGFSDCVDKENKEGQKMSKCSALKKLTVQWEM